MFEPLKDIAYFKSFRVNEDLDTVVWENGADFSPDFLYEIGQPVSEATRAADAWARPVLRPSVRCPLPGVRGARGLQS